MKKKLTKVRKQNYTIYVLGTLAILMGLYSTTGFKSWVEPEPAKIEDGQCYLSRDYKFFKVDGVNQAVERAYMYEMLIYGPSAGGSFYLIKSFDPGETRVRDFKFIRTSYTLVPCEHWSEQP